MHDTRHSISTERSESSVLFNLQELMRIEHDRVLAEETAARAAQLAVERRRLEAEREQAADLARLDAERHAAQQAAERAQAETALRLETERATAVLKAQLAIDAAERAERQQRDLAHARALRELEAQRPRGISGWAFAVTLLALLTAATSAYLGFLRPWLDHSHAQAASAAALAARYTRELAALRSAPIQVEVPVPTRTASSTAPDTAIDPIATQPTRTTPRMHRVRADRSRARTAVTDPAQHVLDPLDGDDDDPLKGLER